MKKRPSHPPPWKRPVWIIWIILAMTGSLWLILHMPADSRRMKPESTSTARVMDSSQNTDAPDMEIGSLTGVARAATTDAPEAQKPAHRMKQRTDAEKIFIKIKTFANLFALVGIAAFFGGLMEARRWHMRLARVIGRLARIARLPEIVGLAMPTALCSNPAANSILVSSHAEGHIRTSTLITGGIANSYMAYISHSIRVMYPVIGAIGLPGALYFGVQFTGGFFILLCVLLWNRWYVAGHGDTPYVAAPVQDAPLPWSGAVSRAANRSLSLLFRMTCMTVPLMLSIEWLLKTGAFDFWEDVMPQTVASLFPAEIFFVIAAQLGGLVQSSAVAANFRAEGLIDNIQILLAMLVGSAVSNPIRMLRRNLPSALGIFPVPVALTIVLGMQLSRFLVTVLATAGVVAIMMYMR